MKRILLYYDNYCGEKSHGGTEVATARIARALKASGEWEVYNACKRRRDKEPDQLYADVAVLRKDFVANLADFIRRNKIDVAVNMGRFYRQSKLERAIRESGCDTKLLFMHHFAPGNESKKHTYKAGLHLLLLEPLNTKYWARVSVYPLFKLQRRLCLSKMYRKILRCSDGVVLLSENYKQKYLETAFGRNAGAQSNETKKFFAIPNIYDNTCQPQEAITKEKRVLILSRMDEIQKRISLALRIWKKIESDPELADWHLDIVGSGDDESAIRKFARRQGLRNVTFHGWKDSKPFLERSPILLSTSAYEGLSLAMIEAQTYGCVPIAFNSYASLPDIVDDGKTGVIVDSAADADQFAAQLATLMKDTERRNAMAAEGRATAAEKFASERIAEQWLAMLAELKIQN